ncbi:hypothetical protein RI056_02405 [Komagataeibacter nataicola]|uniref:hypothetical protein n=1 Tax=Komagataeibacter nataicola TaxID=265960 RepID=UPI0028A98839|nr:hypothetical protein [Komagataeibacter nataicola]WNM08963.1 hypothetical protein RI056_02405 [Komagataeibacter nataicola]
MLGMAGLGVAGWPFRIFQQHWRFAGRSDFWRLGGACALAGGLVLGVLALLGAAVPAFGMVYGMAAFVLLAVVRGDTSTGGRACGGLGAVSA